MLRDTDIAVFVLDRQGVVRYRNSGAYMSEHGAHARRQPRRDPAPAPGSAGAMTITVYGAGAIGGITGARLAQAGHDVLLVDKAADHVAAMNVGGVPWSASDEGQAAAHACRRAGRGSCQRLGDHRRRQCSSAIGSRTRGASVLRRADIGITVARDLAETRLAFRTRVLMTSGLASPWSLPRAMSSVYLVHEGLGTRCSDR